MVFLEPRNHLSPCGIPALTVEPANVQITLVKISFLNIIYLIEKPPKMWDGDESHEIRRFAEF
jgi:hypothetical protein